MDVEDVFGTHFFPHLPDGLHEWLGFDVPHGTTDFGNYHFGVLAFASPLNLVLNRIGNMRNNLDSPPEIVSPPFLAQNFRVDLTSSDVRILIQIVINKPFVVTKVKVCFGPIIGNKHFTVLVWTHRTGIHVNVWVEFLNGNLQAPVL